MTSTTRAAQVLAGQGVQQGRGRDRAGALAQNLLFFQQQQDRFGNLGFTDQRQAVQVAAQQGKGVLTQTGNIDTVRQGRRAGNGHRSAGGERGLGRRHQPALDAENLYPGRDCLNGQSHPGGQTAAAHWHQDGIHLRHVGNYFQAQGSLPGNDIGIVKRMDKGKAGLDQAAGIVPGPRSRSGPAAPLGRRSLRWPPAWTARPTAA